MAYNFLEDNNVVEIKGLKELLNKVAKAKAEGYHAVSQLIREVTLLTQEAVIEKITDDIDAHSGLSRENNPQPVVTDLVDTGAYRASWTPSFPGPLEGAVTTNIEYAAALEYGHGDGEGFHVARDTGRKMRRVFRKKSVDLVKRFFR